MKDRARRIVEALRQPATHDEVLRELQRTREALTALQSRLEALPVTRMIERA